MSEFNGDDYEFALGALQGLRSWDMDELGRLHGVTHREVWTPGENVAACKATKEVPCPKVIEREVKPTTYFPLDVEVGGRRNGKTTRYNDEVVVSVELNANTRTPCEVDQCDGHRHIVPTGHTFDADCQCGFWAYDEAGFKPHGKVVGVIEAYGKTTIGTKGFRAEKAKVVALCREGGKRDELLSLSAWFRLQQLYPDAAFFEDFEEMLGQFGGVLRKWEPVDEGFWSKPVPVREDAGIWGSIYSQAVQKLNSRIFYPSPPPNPNHFFRGGVW